MSQRKPDSESVQRAEPRPSPLLDVRYTSLYTAWVTLPPVR
jgi:hypothetical protein